jgi:hypothetical protein
MLNGNIIVTEGFIKILNEVVVAYLKVLSQD